MAASPRAWNGGNLLAGLCRKKKVSVKKKPGALCFLTSLVGEGCLQPQESPLNPSILGEHLVPRCVSLLDNVSEDHVKIYSAGNSSPSARFRGSETTTHILTALMQKVKSLRFLPGFPRAQRGLPASYPIQKQIN